METIEENHSKSGEMSISPSPSPENLRICLVGDAVNDAATVAAAQSFGVPVITSETGLEIINDYDWRTYFIIKDFGSPLYEAIHRSKQSIMGPPALKHAADMKDGLTHNARPIYNFSMRGVVTCFTGIRKKDELTKLVNLIHSMGGCIRKDMNSKITHLISNHSGGDKYQYAKTFRLTVVRPAWVYAAWEKRDELHFRATTEDFSKEHKLKAFEGQKICFFGFPADEHQHMLDVLKSNGGVSAELDDPECSHVVMPNSCGYFPETISKANSNSPKPSTTSTSTSFCLPTNNNNQIPSTDMQVDEAALNINININKENKFDDAPAFDTLKKDDNNKDNANDVFLNDDNFDERLVVELACDHNTNHDDEDISPMSDDLDEDEPCVEANKYASTPKSSKNLPDNNHTDGIVLTAETPNEFQTANNISPILGTSPNKKLAYNNDIAAMDTDDVTVGGIINVTAMPPPPPSDDNDQFMLDDDDQNDLKRKRESFDSVSLMSIDSFVLPASTKKPKLIRTGSITRSLKRSMSFVAERTPISRMLRPRRSSVALDAPTGDHQNDINTSICSITSVESSIFNDSIRRPVKEKLRNLRDRLTRSSSKKEKSGTPLKTPEKVSQIQNQTNEVGGFKTPKAPLKYTKATSTTPLSSSIGSFASSSQRKSLNISPSNLLNKSTNFGVSVSSATTNVASSALSMSTRFSLTASTTTSISAINFPCNQDQMLNVNQVASSAAAASSIQFEDTETSMCPEMFKTNQLPCTDVVGRAALTVVDEHFTQAKPELKNNRTHILKSDWFWYTIQNGYADEMDYLFGDYLDSIANTPNADRRDSLPISFNKRKRKRFSQRIQLEGTPLGSGKRRSSVSDAGLLSVSGSFFDCTTSPDKLESGVGKLSNEPETSTCEQTPIKKSMRFNHFMDFYGTESNYVGILDTIVNLFKNPLEEMAETNDALLNIAEIKAIFGNFIPIHEVHKRMLERLRQIHSKWHEDCLIGDIILQHRDDLIKAYPPYVNFFEQMKETLQQCDTQNPRFHAFLKINQTKPECGRQSLQDLMIRPVQRLPSISLLLNDILKHTNKNNPDYVKLEKSLKAIKEVMAHINEDKRKTESRMAIFDIFNDIDCCPAHLVSSNRSFISKCEVIELTDELSGRGDSLMLYMFSDTIEVCKKRSRGFNTAKSPSTTKTYKHIKLISLNSIRFVIDITDSPRAFALLCRQDKDRLHSFTIVDEEVDKVVFLKTLCKQMAEHACRTDTDKALLYRTSQELEIDISDVNLSTLSKAFKLAARTRLKVGRAFSFNKTPSKLKRAVSTMMTSPFGSTNSLTPASQLAQMRLASCTNIHEVADEQSSRSSSPSSQSEVLVVPLSVQLVRKNKTCTLNSVGRL